MVPIHDTDIAEERWSKATWENYELWEKVEHRERRSRKLWILATLFVFLVLSAIPICIERWPYWVARSLTRQLAQEVTQMKRDASIARMPFRLRFIDPVGLRYAIEKVTECNAVRGEQIQVSTLGHSVIGENFTWMDPDQGQSLSVPGLVRQFCYDPHQGSDIFVKGKQVAGFAMLSVKDLAEKRLDRMSILLLSGSSAEISFE